MNLIDEILHWLNQTPQVETSQELVPEDHKNPSEDSMSDALSDIRQHITAMQEANQRLEQKVARAEQIARLNASAHGFMWPDIDPEGKPGK